MKLLNRKLIITRSKCRVQRYVELMCSDGEIDRLEDKEMSQRRSRRIAGREPSIVDDETAKVIITELIKRGYSEERANEIAYEDDPEWKEIFFLYMDLKAKGFDEEQALEIVDNHSASYIKVIFRIYDNLLPCYANDGQSTAKFVLLYLEMLDYQFELNDGPLFAALSCAQKMLTECTLRLKEGKLNEHGDIDVGVGGYTSSSREILLPSEITLPAWRKLADTMSSTKRGVIHLCLSQLELGREVSNMLLEASLGTSPLKILSLLGNNLIQNEYGVEFVSSILKANPSLISFCIKQNLIESEADLQSIVSSVIDHPKLETIMLDECGLGCNDALMRSIVPLLDSLTEITLSGNQIGSYGVKLISDCLASNPMVTFLTLTNNLLNDSDAAMLAKSLKGNTNLMKLRIAGNSITQKGLKRFHRALENLSSLNAISDSNHNCCVVGGGEELSKLNICFDPKRNEAKKLMGVMLFEPNMCRLSNIPIELMPRVLYLIQGNGFVDHERFNVLSPLFWFIRQWSMPLLYTSCVGLEPRRSERVRKKMIMKYIVVK